MKRDILKVIRTIDELDVALFNELGLGVELQDFTEPTFSNIECYKLLGLYEKKFQSFLGLRAMHGSFLDVDIGSFNMDFARYSKNLYARDLFFAKILGLDYVTFHGNIKVRYANKNAWKLFIKLQKDFFTEAIDATAYKGTVLLENVIDDSPDMLLELVSEINLPQVKINLDIGHANISSTPIPIWIEKLSPYLAYIHLHSNDGVQDTHSPVTLEDAKLLSECLDKNNLDIPICLEYWNCDIKLEIERLKDVL